MSHTKFTTILLICLATLFGKAGNPGLRTTPANRMSTDIMDFNAISDGQKVFVNWTSVNERKFDYFTIEKSKDGVNFVTAVMIKGAGSINNFVDYSDIDYSPFSGVSYYRLKQTDYFGEIFYSDVITVNFKLSKDGIVVAGPEKDEVKPTLTSGEKKEVLVVLRDNKGHEYFSKIMVANINNTLVATDPKSRLMPGNYMVIASSYNSLYSQHLTVK